MGCMNSPSASSCTDTYSSATNLNKLVDTISNCMTDPSSTACGIYSSNTNLPVMVKNMESCMFFWQSSTCNNRYTSTYSLPGAIKQLDDCMYDVNDASCSASSYGTLLTDSPISGTGIVGYIQQLSKNIRITLLK